MVALMRPATATGTARPDLHTQLYWESTGEGQPVLLVMGLGLSGGAWWRTVDALSRRFRVITFDNRGVGRSRGLTPAYTTEALADDAVGRARRARRSREPTSTGCRSAAWSPSRSRCAIPVASARSCSARPCPAAAAPQLADEEVMAFFCSREHLPRRRPPGRRWPTTTAAAAATQHADRIAEDIRRRLAYNFDEDAYKAQLMAAALHNCTSRLRRIGVPALVIHGEDDRVVPVDNAHLIASRLPDGRLHLLPSTGHLYTTEAPEADAEVGRFLDAVG